MIAPLDNLLNFTNDLFQKKELKPLYNQIASTAQYLWERGWAERNAGNFTVNLTGFFTTKELERLTSHPFFPFPGEFPDLAGNLFLVSGTGTRMRDTAKNPMDHVCFLYLAERGSVFHIISGRPDGTPVLPTSEITTHLAIQQQLVKQRSASKVVLHAHVTELIALTQLSQFQSEEAVNQLLQGMHPEISLFLPDGVGFIPYTLSGTDRMAVETLKGLVNHQAIIWEKHGCISVSHSPDDAFDILDIIAKAARIFFLSVSSGYLPQGLRQEQINEIRTFFPGK
jgi:rhamnulose-1-phosphate aldolase